MQHCRLKRSDCLRQYSLNDIDSELPLFLKIFTVPLVAASHCA